MAKSPTLRASRSGLASFLGLGLAAGCASIEPLRPIAEPQDEYEAPASAVPS